MREKITSAGACKERGNAAFAQSDFTGALRHYHEALLYVKGLDTGAGGNAMAAMAMYVHRQNRHVTAVQPPSVPSPAPSMLPLPCLFSVRFLTRLQTACDGRCQYVA